MRLFRRRRSQQHDPPALGADFPADTGAPPARAVGPGGLLRTFSSLAIPSFRMLWFGTFFAMAAMQVDVVSRSWLAYHLSGSGLTLGLVALARGLPMLLVSFVAGVAVDRLDKRKLLIGTQFALAVVALANALVVHLGVVEIWHLVVLALLQGAIFPFGMPARQAYIPELVGERQLANALALNATGLNVNRVLVPVVAGLLLAWDPAIAFYAIVILYGAGALTLLRLPRGRRSGAAKPQGTLTDMLVGFRYIWNHRVLRTLIGMAFIPVLLGLPFQQLLPVFQSDVLHVGPPQLGLMFTAAGIGSLVGSLTVARLSEYPRKGLLQLIAGACFGISLALFALSTVFELSVGLLVIVGFFSQGYLTINNVLIMLNTDRQFYGRVMSVYLMTWSLMPISLMPMGALVDVVGAPATVAGSGILLAVFIALIAVLFPAQRKARTDDRRPTTDDRRPTTDDG